MAIHKIRLEIDDNPEYYSLIREYNELMDRYNSINNRIHEFIIPKFLFYKVKKTLNNIGADGLKLQSDFINWNKKASNFAIEPKYKIDSTNEHKELIYVHFTDNLRFTINYLRSYITLLSENYNNRHNEYQERRNFIIAITAFFIGIASFVISIFSIFHEPNLDRYFDILKTSNKQVNENIDHVKSNIDSLTIKINEINDYSNMQNKIMVESDSLKLK